MCSAKGLARYGGFAQHSSAMSKIKNLPTQISNKHSFIEDSGPRESTVVMKAPIDLCKTVLIFVFLLLVAYISVS